MRRQQILRLALFRFHSSISFLQESQIKFQNILLDRHAEKWELKKVQRILQIPKKVNGKIDWNLYHETIDADLKNQLSTNFWTLLYSYSRNIASNATSPSGFVCNLRKLHNSSFFEPLKQILCKVSRLQNTVLSLVGLLGFLTIFFRKKVNHEHLPILWWLVTSSVLTAYFVLVSGISLAQGDRLHLPIFGIAIIQLVMIYKLLFSSKKQLRKDKMPILSSPIIIRKNIT